MKLAKTLALLLTMAALSLLAEDGVTAAAGRITGVVKLVNEDGSPRADRSGAVVYVDGIPGPLPDASRDVHAIHQRDKQFYPRQLVVRKGSTIEFPNDDRIDHNVFSLSRILRFDLGMYRSGASKKIVARRAGVVDVFCNIHSEMSAKILVVDTPHYVETDAEGRYSLRGLPAGRYKLHVWHARGESQETDVELGPSASTEKSFRVVVTNAPDRHVRKNGTPYGRYQ